MLRRYLVDFKAGQQKTKKVDAVRKKKRHINLVSQALAEQPALAEHVPSSSGGAGRVRIRTGAMQTFLNEHRDRLQALAKQIRASTPVAHSQGSIMPQDNKAWLGWLDANYDHFSKIMYTDAPQQRRALNQRLVPRVQFGNVPAESGASNAEPLPLWTGVLEGHYAPLNIQHLTCWCMEIVQTPISYLLKQNRSLSMCLKSFPIVLIVPMEFMCASNTYLLLLFVQVSLLASAFSVQAIPHCWHSMLTCGDNHGCFLVALPREVVGENTSMEGNAPITHSGCSSGQAKMFVLHALVAFLETMFAQYQAVNEQLPCTRGWATKRRTFLSTLLCLGTC